MRSFQYVFASDWSDVIPHLDVVPSKELQQARYHCQQSTAILPRSSNNSTSAFYPNFQLSITMLYVTYSPSLSNIFHAGTVVMIVDQFNTTLSGGAAVAAKRLHHALLESGISSRLFYLQQKQRQTVQDESYLPAHSAWSSRGLTPRMWSRKQLQRLKFKHALRGRPPGLEMFSCPEVLPHTQIDVANLGTDIIQLHWVAKLIDYASFFASIPSDFPIVWTLHDIPFLLHLWMPII